MLTLVINNEKYLTLNLSEELNCIFTFLVKSYTTSTAPNSISQGIKKKSAFGSLTLPFVIFVKKVPFFSISSIILRHFWVKLHKKCPFEDSRRCPEILNYTMSVKLPKELYFYYKGMISEPDMKF